MKSHRTATARRLRKDQTEEEKQLWRELKAGRFAGFKFRRQHPIGSFYLDFYCPLASLAIELDGFQHGLPSGAQRDAERSDFLSSRDVEVLRFWNRQWHENRDGVLTEIWLALQRRTGCTQVARNEANRRFVPPSPDSFVDLRASSPRPSPPPCGGEGES